MKYSDVRPIAKRVIATAMAITTSWSLMGSPIAFAADSFAFDDGSGMYTDAYTNDDGSFSWDGADQFTLTDYEGVGWVANGDADVDLNGANAVTGPIATNNGDLSITGDGSLDVDGGDAPALTAVNGDVNIESTTVNATSELPKEIDQYANSLGTIEGIEGDVNITSSDVSATMKSDAEHVGSHAILAVDGDVNIKDSTVSAVSEGGADVSSGIMAIGFEDETAPTVNIDNSYVYAEGDGMSITAMNLDNADAPGKVNITNSTIVAPEGAHVQDLLVKYVFDGGDKGTWYGQTIGKGEGVIDSFQSKDIVTAVLIAPVAEAISNQAASKLPTTGDTTSNNGVAAIATAGALFTAAAVLARKRTQE